MQAGRNAKAGNKLREVSAAMTMISLVGIYTLVNGPSICLWAAYEIISILWPASNLVTVTFNAARVIQVSLRFN